jgi:predicted MFS family arabinose efflux permease
MNKKSFGTLFLSSLVIWTIGNGLLPLLPVYAVQLKTCMVIIYFITSAGVLVLSQSTELWHFWLASGLLSIAVYTTGSVTGAFVTDLLSPETLNKGLSLFSATPWIGAIAGFAGAGYWFEQLGTEAVFFGAACLPIIAVALLLLLQPHGITRPMQPEPVH